VFRLLMKISVAMSAPNLSGMRVVSFDSFPVTGQTGWRYNTELLWPDDRSPNAVLQSALEGTVTPPDCDLMVICVVQVKVSR
jgi:hypothetical protein